ncbi:MAG: VanW family protein [Defluviitaleaceae bacterium]|nr:VanW family protein [Defluviitaleaceae bacterium]
MDSSVYREIAAPLPRSALRVRLGVRWHTLKRHIKWLTGGYDFGKCSQKRLEHVHFAHESPLLRHLAGVSPHLEQNKVKNLEVCVPRVHGLILLPGQSFSFWKSIGKPSRFRGFVEGVVLKDGQFAQGVGGGLCHLSGFIYWMTLHTPLSVTERHRHAYDTTPTKFFGADATCFYNYKDLMVKNNTKQPFQLIIEIGSDTLTGAWASDCPPVYSYELYERAGELREKTRHNHVYRRVFELESGVQVADEFVAENHAFVMKV